MKRPDRAAAIAILVALTFGAGLCRGGPIIYQINQTLGFSHGTLTGTIETDGTLGATNIVGWNLLLDVAIAGPPITFSPYRLTSGAGGDSTVTVSGSGLSATSTNLFYDFGAGGTMQFFDAATSAGLWFNTQASGQEGLEAPGAFGDQSPLGSSPQPYPIGTALTALSQQGGPSTAPVFLVGTSVSLVTGTISGFGSQDYYSFYWPGGVFSAFASITGASPGGSYLYTAGVAGACSGLLNETLDSTNNFSGAISFGNLAAGNYCIGLDANNQNDPTYLLSFATPVGSVPEPCDFALVVAGLGIINARRFAGRHRQKS